MKTKIRNIKGRATLILLSTMCMLSITACGVGDTEARQIVEKSGHTITVMDNTTESVYTKLKLEGIEKLDGVRGMDWLSENVLVVDHENKALPPVTVEGEERYPRNLYLHDLSAGQETPLKEEGKTLGFPLMSPDKKHVFYKETYESTGIGYIMDLETRVSVKTGDYEFMTTEGEWIDNEHVIFPSMEGNIISADVRGMSEVVVDTGTAYVHNVVQSGNRIYYIAHEDSQLFVYDTDTKQSKVIKKDVMWVIPSPDGSQLAIVKRTASTEMTLFLCDNEGNEQTAWASGTQVFGTSWSPDGSMVAYTTISENGNENRLFITEVETGEQTPISNDIQASDKLRWSPSGKKLLASAAVMKDNVYQFITYIIKLS